MRGTPRRWSVIAVVALLAGLGACSSADPAPSGGPRGVENSSSPHTDEGNATDTSASKEFCSRYNEYMGALLQGGSAAEVTVLPKLDALIDGAPGEFQQWTKDFSPWVKAQLADDRAALSASVDASEEAGYQISNRCQFVLADM